MGFADFVIFHFVNADDGQAAVEVQIAENVRGILGEHSFERRRNDGIDEQAPFVFRVFLMLSSVPLALRRASL